MADFAAAIRPDAFLEGPLVTRRIRTGLGSESSAKAAFALLLLVATWRQSRRFVREVKVPGYEKSGLKRTAELLAAATGVPLAQVLLDVLNHCVVDPHLRTTLRKMGNGLKCSLRFFPDGDVLRLTGMSVRAGFSGDRLGNVLNVLTDIGLIEWLSGNNANLTERGRQLRERLGGG